MREPNGPESKTDGGIVSGVLHLHTMHQLENGNLAEVFFPEDIEEREASEFAVVPRNAKKLLRFSPVRLEWDGEDTLYFESDTEWVDVPFDTNEEWQLFWEELWFTPVFELTHPDFPEKVFKAYLHETPDWHGPAT